MWGGIIIALEIFIYPWERYKLGSRQGSSFCCVNTSQKRLLTCHEQAVHSSVLLWSLPLLLWMIPGHCLTLELAQKKDNVSSELDRNYLVCLTPPTTLSLMGRTFNSVRSTQMRFRAITRTTWVSLPELLSWRRECLSQGLQTWCFQLLFFQEDIKGGYIKSQKMPCQLKQNVKSPSASWLQSCPLLQTITLKCTAVSFSWSL